eukprot:GABV01000968.1.p1 GENE.GABV01000968.1~~GABV01000968.1.p1  ORF type:complete len:323 (+),score=117.24 GABV01000968.1:127-969(+)
MAATANATKTQKPFPAGTSAARAQRRRENDEMAEFEAIAEYTADAKAALARMATETAKLDAKQREVSSQFYKFAESMQEVSRVERSEDAPEPAVSSAVAGSVKKSERKTAEASPTVTLSDLSEAMWDATSTSSNFYGEYVKAPAERLLDVVGEQLRTAGAVGTMLEGRAQAAEGHATAQAAVTEEGRLFNEKLRGMSKERAAEGIQRVQAAQREVDALGDDKDRVTVKTRAELGRWQREKEDEMREALVDFLCSSSKGRSRRTIVAKGAAQSCTRSRQKS